MSPSAIHESPQLIEDNSFIVKSLTKCPCKVKTEPDKNGMCPPCSDPDLIMDIGQYILKKGADIDKTNSVPITNNDDMNIMAYLTNCKSERCVLESDLMREVAPSSLVDESISKLKSAGPANTVEWLSNFNINDKLQELEGDFNEFGYMDTTMMDFASQGGSLDDPASIISMIENGKQIIGCVINTDYYSSCGYGKQCGQHWVCVIIDTRKGKDTNWSIEYFDSVGDPPPKEIVKWQAKIQKVLDAYRAKKGHTGGVNVVNSNVQHQHKNTECGVYCLYYIRSRAEDISPYGFNQEPIADEKMINFRRYLFTD